MFTQSKAGIFQNLQSLAADKGLILTEFSAVQFTLPTYVAEIFEHIHSRNLCILTQVQKYLQIPISLLILIYRDRKSC